MPSFCRHNRLVQNCPICSREQQVEMRPVVTPGATRAAEGVPRTPASPRSPGQPGSRRRGPADGRQGLRVRRLERGADDGYRSALAPGLRSSADAERLAAELAWAATRLDRLATDPPGLYAVLADGAIDLEERTWLALLIAYLGPRDEDDPFAAIAAVRTPWSGGHAPELEGCEPGPRGSWAPGHGTRTLNAYRAWASRSGSQASALTGEESWTPERRFARAAERLATLPDFERGSRFDLLATLGATGAYALSAGALGFGGSDPVTLGAKRLLGIGDPLLLERRALTLAEACALPLAALDLGFFNWEHGQRSRGGMPADLEADITRLACARTALGL